MLYRIANLSSVWIEFEAFESTVSNLSTGDSVEFTVSSVSGQVYTEQSASSSHFWMKIPELRKYASPQIILKTE
ncbi:efflux RND transporter periplasmic adaptor subunit [Gracilimonas sp.]|uniref:efflux RND transporter periplasmic adaptor subunit n=1 Tax=Gracilimonas sp. TaxID=1974203 RepID=UPI00375392DD